MSGSQIFIIYANAAGTNVTLSPRLGIGHQQPSAETSSQATLLSGSGIANGNMTANILCHNCNAWADGGSMNLYGSKQPWIWASKSGGPIKSDSVSAVIQQHDSGAYATFFLDLNDIAPGTSNGSNPFLDLANAHIVDTNDTASEGGTVLVTLHGVVMCLAFIIGFPLGAFLIRMASFGGIMWLHAGWQLLSYLGALLGMGLGAGIIKKGAADVGFDLHGLLLDFR